jgi:TolB-like protein/Tfp pilus assembly protein PilF
MSVPLIAELKRRRVFRALAGYAIVAFAVLQVIEPVVHGLHLPEWTISFVVIVLAVGLPVTLVLAWAFDLSAGGIERTLPLQPEGMGRGRIALVLAAVTAAALVPALAWQFTRPGATPAPTIPAAPSVAVLPFVNISPSKDDEYFSDGITEEVINALANVEGLRVVSRTSAFAYKNKSVGVRQIGEELAVATVLEGSVRREGNALRLTAQLINTADGYHLWSKTFDRELKSVFAVEDELARSIVEALKPRLLKGAKLVQQGTGNTEAHDLYLKGRHFWAKRTPDDLREAMTWFEKAIAADPSYALAHAGVADTYMLLAEYSAAPRSDAVAKARPHAYRALELAGDLAEAHASLGLISLHDFEWETAEREFKRAIELRSGYVTAHHWYALLLVGLGRFDEAQAEVERALQLDPASPVVNNVRGVVFFDQRQYDRAIAAFRKTLELNPGFASSREILACTYAMSGRAAEALAELDQIRASAAEHLALRAWILAASGDAAGARKLLVNLESQRAAKVQTHPAMMAAFYAHVGETERAFGLLEKAYAERDPMLRDLKVNPIWDPIRNDARFGTVLKQMRLDPTPG